MDKVERAGNLMACGAESRWVFEGIDASDKTSEPSYKKDEAPRTARERRKEGPNGMEPSHGAVSPSDQI